MVKIGLVADAHYAPKGMLNGRYYRESLERLRECAGEFVRQGVDAAVNMGDLIDTTHNADEARAHLTAALGVLGKYPGPWYHVLGNHDILEMDKAQFLGQCTGDGNLVEKHCGYGEFVCGGWRFLFLDGNFDGTGRGYRTEDFDWTDCHLNGEQLSWLQKALAQSQEPVIVLTHENLDERMTPEGRDLHVLHNSGEVRRVLEESGKVRAVLQGHCHTGYDQVIDSIPYVTLPSLVVDVPGTGPTFAILELEGDMVRLKGYGKQQDREL